MTVTVSWTPSGTAGKLRERLQSAARWGARQAGAVVRPHRGALANLRQMPMFLAGLASMDFAAFHLAHGWGWLATGISLIIAEHAAADE